MAAPFDSQRALPPKDFKHPHAEAIASAWDRYEGRYPQPLLVQPGDPDDNTVVNLAQPIIDKGISFLFGKELTWQADETAARDSGAETWLKEVWAANNKMGLLHEVAQNGFLGGVAAIKVNPTPGSTDPPQLVNIDPATLTLAWTPGNVDDICGYAITFEEDAQRRTIWYRQEITRVGGRGTNWLLSDYQAEADESWKLVKKPTAWPFPIAPIIHCKNLPRANSAWGYGDLQSGRLNEALNTITSSARKTLRIHGTPQTVGKGVKGQNLKRNPAGMWEIAREDDIYNVELKSDLASSQAYYHILRAAIYSGQRTPDMSTIAGQLGTLTNFGLRVLFADLIDMNSTKQILYGGMIKRLNQLLCMIGKRGNAVKTTLSWADPLPVNGLDKANEIAVKKKTGLISDETLTAEYGAGYVYADEKKRLDQQRAAAPALPAPANGSAPAPASAAMGTGMPVSMMDVQPMQPKEHTS